MTGKIALACSKCGTRNYTTHKRESIAQRLSLNKYCKNCSKHTLHRETK